jgi:hypothetical protein
MKLFFGRINVNQEPKDQIKNAYYAAPKGTSYFGDLNSIEDFSKEPIYVFMIANSRIHLWKASHWGEDGQNLYFTVVKENIPELNGAWFAAFKYFYLNLDLIIFTIKRPFKKAFFSIQFDADFTEELLLKDDIYQENASYRKIKLLQKAPIAASKDIQLYLEDYKWHIADVLEMDENVKQDFRDNTPYIGKGRKRKDNVLAKIKPSVFPEEFNADYLAIWHLYDTFFCDYNAAEKVIDSVERKYFKYSPGSNASRWNHDLEAGSISISFSENDIDLTNVEGRKELNELFQLPEDSKSNKTWNLMLFKEARIGDVIFANRGVNALLGIGVITGEYVHDDEVSEYKHTRDVEWICDKVWEYQPNQIATYRTLFRPDTFSPTLPYREILTAYVAAYPEYTEVLKEHDLYFESKPSLLQHEEETEETVFPLNQILYGPPGTGKTYLTIDESVKIIDGEASSEHETNKKRFNILREEGQIEFVTFHQNYSYEDFMVGIRPDASVDQLRFKPFAGIFYQLNQRAKENYLASKEKRSINRTFDDVFSEYITLLEVAENIPVVMASGKKFYITEVEDGTIRFEKENGSSQHTLSVSTLKTIVEGTREFNSGLGIYYKPLMKELQERQKKQTGPKETIKRYVLIIDEINRANISRVFGELITLLEDDKRLGKPNELKVSLPNGEKDFGIAPNLYVIGTMNTADKSIALLDIALRRRFEFVGYYPNPDVLTKNQKSDRVPLLKAINKAIYQKKKTADYLIGHAYFLREENTDDIILKKIIPLLMEYFNGRTEEVTEIFNDTDWLVKYNSDRFMWSVEQKK